MEEIRFSNWIGLWTLYLREVRRFIKVRTQTILAPIVTTLLFLAIFTLAMGRADQTIGGAAFAEFLAPGLIMMAIIQNSFANTSSSMIIAKVQGNIVDTLMPPLAANELTLAISLGGVTRGLIVGAAVGLAIIPFAPLRLHDAGFIVFHALAASLMLSLMGLAGGIWAEKFDHIAAVTNFVVMPLSFLSGTFYSVDQLSGAFRAAAFLNPAFYAIDGFRYGFIGHSDAPLGAGIAVMIGVNLGLWMLCRWMFKTGYKLKA